MSSGSALPISRSCTELEDGTSKPIRRKSFRGAIGTSLSAMDATEPSQSPAKGLVRFCFDLCCARATSGQVAAVPPRRAMNSRRLMGRSQVEDHMLPHRFDCVNDRIAGNGKGDRKAGLNQSVGYPIRD